MIQVQKNRVGAIVAVIMLVFSPTHVQAKDRAIPQGEVRVRVAARSDGGAEKLRGQIIEVRSDSLLIRLRHRPNRFRPGAIVPLAWSDISGLDRYSGSRGHAGSGALIGLLVGAGAGAIVGNAMFPPGSSFGFTGSSGGGAGGGAILGGVSGLALGTLIGWIFVRRDKWEAIPIESVRHDSPSR